MRNVLIYTIDKMLYFHSHQVIREGMIQLIDVNGIVIREYPINDTEFSCHQLEVNPGKYLARFKSNETQLEKKLTIF